MSVTKPRQKVLSDEGPIVFPVPTSNPSDVFPPDFKQPSDLVVDPYGNFYCFVCQVSVPRGDANVSQHLTGKKHDTHNRRFAATHEKDSVRQRVLQAALQQRVARGVPLFTSDAAASAANHSASVQNPRPPATPVPPQTPSNPNGPSQSSPASVPIQPPSTPSVQTSAALPVTPSATTRLPPEGRTRKGKLMAEAKRLRSIQIDKQAFLSQLLADQEESQPVSGPDHHDSNHTDSFDLNQRLQPFGPLVYKPPEGPDFFFESMAEQTAPSQAAAKIRVTLANRDNSLAVDNKSDTQRADAITEEGEANDFLSFDRIAKDEAEVEESREREKAREEAKKSLIILKDESGEQLPPWLLDPEAAEKVLYSSDSSVSLHYEILEFSRFMSPTQIELDSRNELVVTVESIVKQLWPSSSLQVFGSYATDLYLPSSDVDICVMETPEGGSLEEFEQLAQAMRNVTGFVRQVHVIKATVTLVKIITRKSCMNCDISIGVANGPKYVPLIKSYVQLYPALRPLLLVVKCFLKQRDLNEVYSGGLGSYSVLLLVVSHLQMLKYNFESTKANLGRLLQLFFQLYGRMHNLCLAGIQVKDNGCYFDKFERYHTPPQEVLRQSIEDPNDVTNELGRKGYAASRVRKAFGTASKTLVNWRRDHSDVPPTPLSAILQPDELFQFRRVAVIADLEKKGKKPVRESLDVLNKRLGRPKGASQVQSTSEGNTGRPSYNDNLFPVNTSGRKRPPSPDRRRERDPRLAKRRRSGAENDRSRTDNQPRVDPYESGGPRVSLGSARGARAANGVNVAYTSPPSNLQNVMFHEVAGYSGQAPFNQPSYSPATPGYQYVGGGMGMTDPYSSQNYVNVTQQMMSQQAIGNAQSMNSAQGIASSQHMGQAHGQFGRNNDGGHMNRGRGRSVKRGGYRPRRGGSRGY